MTNIIQDVYKETFAPVLFQFWLVSDINILMYKHINDRKARIIIILVQDNTRTCRLYLVRMEHGTYFSSKVRKFWLSVTAILYTNIPIQNTERVLDGPPGNIVGSLFTLITFSIYIHINTCLKSYDTCSTGRALSARY